jgi:acetoacetyl-CoA synthetase
VPNRGADYSLISVSEASITRGEVLSLARSSGTQAHQFLDYVKGSIDPTIADYRSLHAWSVREPAMFWNTVSRWFGVRWHQQPVATLEATPEIIGTRWWCGGTLNFAERVLQMATGHEHETVIVAYSDSRARVELSWGQLVALIAHYQSVLIDADVRTGDRVVAFLPNVPETIAIFLACAAHGATFSSCPPEFGEDAVISRFSQIEPKLLFFVDRYQYGGKSFDKADIVARICTALPTLTGTHRVEIGDDTDLLRNMSSSRHVDVTAVESDHPLYILYSSGTTGLPKPIIHGHAGILHEHIKIMALHHDLKHGDRFMWYSTTGWVMWNYLVSSLLVGTTIVLYDGDPAYPDLSVLWSVAEREKLTMIGLGANFINNCMKSGLEPGARFDLTALRIVGSTGSPLAADGYRWIHQQVSTEAVVHSICGGTDVGSAFLGMSPLLPVRAGEMSCALLGADVRALRPDGSQCHPGETGELVIATPMPSMPVGLWNDPDGTRLRSTYFDDFPGTWRHGDWITIFDDGMAVVSGRSDATLNRGGVRLGTAEFYGVVEALAFVADSLVVHFAMPGEDLGKLLLFVQVRDGELTAERRSEIVAELRARLSPRHIPDEIIAVGKIPRTLSGKKLEIPVKKILLGGAPHEVCSLDSLVDASALDVFVALRSKVASPDVR